MGAPPTTLVADELDRAILRVLQIDARRPYSAIAAELGVSDQTVARRHQRLTARAGVRVFALAQPNVNTHDLWLLRVRARDNLNTLADNLIRRDDTAWMHCVCGPAGLEVTAMVYRDRGESRNFPLLEQLSALPSVDSVSAQSCLHMFFGGPTSLLTKSAASTHGAPRNGDGSSPRRRNASQGVVDADRRLMAALAVDGRASLKELSAVTGLAHQTVSQRLELLETSGALYYDVDFDPDLLGLRKAVSVWATVTPSSVEDAGRVLATHGAISFATATTGTTNIYAVAHCVDDDALYRYLSGPLAELPGLQSVETAPHVGNVKGARRNPAD